MYVYIYIYVHTYILYVNIKCKNSIHIYIYIYIYIYIEYIYSIFTCIMNTNFFCNLRIIIIYRNCINFNFLAQIFCSLCVRHLLIVRDESLNRDQRIVSWRTNSHSKVLIITFLNAHANKSII